MADPNVSEQYVTVTRSDVRALYAGDTRPSDPDMNEDGYFESLRAYGDRVASGSIAITEHADGTRVSVNVGISGPSTVDALAGYLSEIDG